MKTNHIRQDTSSHTFLAGTMKELGNLVELTELFELLGYQDERSVIKWCGRNNIPIVKLGLKKYIPSHLLAYVIDNQLFIFEEGKAIDGLTHKVTLENSDSVSHPKGPIFTKYLEKYGSPNKIKTAKKS
jgi:hypothetical protein